MVELTKRFNMRMTDIEMQMLQELAKHNGITVSAFIRMQIRTLYREAFGRDLPRKPRK